MRYGCILGIFLQALFGLLITPGVVVFAIAFSLLGYVRAALVRFALFAVFLVSHGKRNYELEVMNYELEIISHE